MNRKHPWSYTTRQFVAIISGTGMMRWQTELVLMEDKFGTVWWITMFCTVALLQFFIYALIGGEKENS